MTESTPIYDALIKEAVVNLLIAESGEFETKDFFAPAETFQTIVEGLSHFILTTGAAWLKEDSEEYENDVAVIAFADGLMSAVNILRSVASDMIDEAELDNPDADA